MKKGADSIVENCGIIFSLSVIESAPGKRQDAASTFTSLIFIEVQEELFLLMQTQHPAAFRSAPYTPAIETNTLDDYWERRLPACLRIDKL